MRKTDNVWSQLEEFTNNIPGWSPTEELFSLHHLALLTSELPGDILEVGAWCGRSSAALALALQELGSGHLFSIDLFPEKSDWYQNSDRNYSFSVEIEGKKYCGYTDQTVWEKPFKNEMEPIYDKHKSPMDVMFEKLEQYGLIQLVTAFRGDCKTFTKRQDGKLQFRLAFIDGDHGYKAVSSDIQVIAPLLVPGGWIAFDDAFTSYDGVNSAIEELIIKNDQFDLCYQPTRKLFAARKKM